MKKLLFVFAAASTIFVGCEKDEIDSLNSDLARTEAELQANINQNTNAINELDARLSAAIAAEEAAREAGDNALADALASAVARLEDLLAAEEAARIAGDSDLLAQLNSAVADLNAAIAAEAAARQAGDQELSDNLEAAIQRLSGLISDEESARIAGDSALNSALEAARAQLSQAIEANSEADSIQAAMDLNARNILRAIIDGVEDRSVTGVSFDSANSMFTFRFGDGNSLQRSVSSLNENIQSASYNENTQILTIVFHNGVTSTTHTFDLSGLEESADITALETRLNNLINSIDSRLGARIDAVVSSSGTNSASIAALNAFRNSFSVTATQTANGNGYDVTISASGISDVVFSILNGQNGAPGTNGNDGSNGADGASFDASLFSVTTSDVASGTQVTISYNGTQLAQFVIEDGDEGPRGPQGPAGPQGPQGPAGGGTTDTASDTIQFGAWVEGTESGGVDSNIRNSGNPVITYHIGSQTFTTLQAAQASVAVGQTVTIITRTTQARIKDVSAVVRTDTRDYSVVVQGIADDPAPTAAASDLTRQVTVTPAQTGVAHTDDVSDSSASYTANDQADTFNFGSWSAWTGTAPDATTEYGSWSAWVTVGNPPSTQATITQRRTRSVSSVVAAYQETRSRSYTVQVNGVADNPAPVPAASELSESRNVAQVSTPQTATIANGGIEEQEIANPNYQQPAASVTGTVVITPGLFGGFTFNITNISNGAADYTDNVLYDTEAAAQAAADAYLAGL